MSHTDRQSKVTVRNRDEIPASLSEAAFLLDSLQQDGTLKGVGDRCLIRREGGYCGLDVVLFLLVYFASSPAAGMRPFYEKARPFWKHLGALAGRGSLPTPPSVSRALLAADSTSLRAFYRWLLTESLGIGDLLAHPAAQSRDAVGIGWQIYHFDPTCSALRQRALPVREGLPDAIRRGAHLGEPGHAGRKRGEIMFTRSVLQHAGSGLLLDMRVEAGQGDQRQQLGSAVNAVVHVCKVTAHPTDRVVICADGQWGGVPSIATFRAAGICFVTRCLHRSLLDRAEIRRAMERGEWVLVPDSGSGPERGAVDVGRVLLDPAENTRKDDGSAYASQRVRLIVTRYPEREDSKKKAKRGTVLDHVCYEMFVTDLAEDAWPVEAVVALYFGRCAQENRFAQEDRELELDRIYSYEPAGQELAATVGAFVWNWRIMSGFRLNPLDNSASPQRECVPALDSRPLPNLHVDPEYVAVDPPQPASEVAVEERADPPPVDMGARASFRESSRLVIQRYLPELLRGTVLEKRGWTVRKQTAELVCPNGEMFRWNGITEGSSHRAKFRTSNLGVCASCPLRLACRRDVASKDDFKPTLLLPAALADRLEVPSDLRPPSPDPRPGPMFLLPPGTVRGSLEIAPARLLPARMRKAARLACGGVDFEVTPPSARAGWRSHAFLAPDARHQRHGRCTHAENLGRYALPADAVVKVTTRGSRAELARAASVRRQRAPG